MNGIESNILQVWCHNCAGNSNASVNLSNDEFTCNRCESTFVEELDQGIEEFRNVISEDRSSNDNESETEENRDLLRQIMERVVGMQNQLGRTSPTDLLLPSNGSGPIGIIIRSPSLPPDILRGPNPVLLGGGSMMLPVSAATRNDARGFPEARDGSGILGLLNTLSLLRPGSLGEADPGSQFEQFLHHILMNESSHAGAPPASEQTIQALKRDVVVTCGEAEECSISQEMFVPGDTRVTLPCEHRFKEEPIVHWLKMHNTCPVCRVDITQSGLHRN